MPNIIEYTQYDTRPVISGTYKDQNGTAIDITSYTIYLSVDFPNGALTKTGTVTNGTAGQFQFVFGTSDLATTGTFDASIRFENSGAVQTARAMSDGKAFQIRIKDKIV